MFSLYPFQEEAVDFLWDKKAVLLGDDMGLGKAQPLSEPVLTPTGWTEIGKLSVGDYVIGSNGKPTKVNGVYLQGTRPICEVWFSDDTFVRCDIDHLWSVITPNNKRRGKPYETISTREMIRLGLKSSSGNNRYYVPNVEPVQFIQSDISLDPYLVGVFIGNGCLSHGTYLSTDHDIVSSLIIPNGVTFRLEKDNGYSGDYRFSGIVRHLRELGLMNKKAEEKHIPIQYKWGDIETRYACLQGILDTDGSIVKSRGKPATTVEYSTVSKQLSEDVEHIVRSLGGKKVTKIPKYKGETRTGQLFYRMTLSLPTPFVPFRLKRKLDNWIHRSKYEPVRAIKAIQYIGYEPCVCISVEANDCLYVTRSFTLTHNTVTAIALDRRRREKQPNLVEKPKTLVVTYLGIFSSWLSHFEDWAPDLRVMAINSKDRTPFLESIKNNEADVFVCHWQSLRLLPELVNTTWFHIIADECVIAGTRISTPKGLQNIEDLQNDDVVYGYDHKQQKVVETTVKHTFSRTTRSQLFKINSTVMTGNHPVWTNESNYINASALNSMEHTLLRLTNGNSDVDLRIVPEPISLHDRHSKPGIENSNRSRWFGTPFDEQETNRPREGQIFNLQRMDSVSIHEPRSYDKPKVMRTEGIRVYNIETGTGNYFANGILVHNCHALQNRKSKQSVALKLLKTCFKTGLSGTPAFDKPDDLWSILNWLYPDFWSSYWRYYNRHILYVENSGYRVIVGVSHAKELQEQMSGFYVRRRKEEVLKELPDKYYSTIEVDLHPRQMRVYEQMRKDMIAWVGEHEDEPVDAPVIIAQLTRLQQFASAYGEIDQETNRMVLSEPSAKLTAVMDLIESTDEPVVIFSQFAQVIRLLQKRLEKASISHGIFIGDTSPEKRSRIIEDFQNQKIQVFAGTISAGGIGITLTASSTVVFTDRSWSASLNRQAADRLHRVGQKNAVHVIDIIARDTIDAKRIEHINLKWSWIRELLGEEDYD